MEPTTYRDAASERLVARIDALASEREAAVLRSFAGGALVMGRGDPIGLARHVVRSSTARRRQDALACFFGGDELIEEPNVWVSPDGTRRLRVVHGDPLPRWEEIDPTRGETLSSVWGPSPIAPPASGTAPFEREAARVHGRARSPRCFAGLPRRLGGRPVARPDACSVVLASFRHGVSVVRLDEASVPVGDTWHPDRASAVAQLALEYGDRLGGWHEVEALRDGALEPALGWAGYERTRLSL